MIRMIKEDDIFACWWWYNWYITHSTVTFETEPVSQQEFAERVHNIRKQYPWLVLQDEDVIKGYAYLGHFNDRAAYDWTADVSIYIAPDERHHGYGRQLMQAIIDTAKKDGYKKLVSLVTSENEPSKALHEQFGFKKEAEFDQFGYKSGRWLGVTYYVLTLCDEFETDPKKPVNIDPYPLVRKGRVPLE